MALLLYFVGNMNASLTAHGDAESLDKKLQELKTVPEIDRVLKFKSFNPEAGGNNSVNITIFNPTVNLSHVVEEDDKVLGERMEEQRKTMLLNKARSAGGVFEH